MFHPSEVVALAPEAMREVWEWDELLHRDWDHEEAILWPEFLHLLTRPETRHYGLVRAGQLLVAVTLCASSPTSKRLHLSARPKTSPGLVREFARAVGESAFRTGTEYLWTIIPDYLRAPLRLVRHFGFRVEEVIPTPGLFHSRPVRLLRMGLTKQEYYDGL